MTTITAMVFPIHDHLKVFQTAACGAFNVTLATAERSLMLKAPGSQSNNLTGG